MPNRAHGLRVTALALLVAIAGTTTIVAPVAATDPAPVVPTTPSPSPAPDPSATPPDVPSASATATVVAPAPVIVPNLGQRVVRIALAQRGDQYRAGGQGPRSFDCSGLVRFSYRKAGVSGRLGGGSSARGMLYWGRLHGLTSTRNPRAGDIAIYGNGSHAAIWIGNGRVVHALNPRLDIRVTTLRAMTTRFTTFIHTRIPRG